MPTRIDSEWLFPSPQGNLWRYSNFSRRVWQPACEAAGIDPTPHEFRHSWVSNLRAQGVDPADLAQVAGHSVDTATARYTHALGRSDEAIKAAIG
jgi:integrase